jgi:hypothetical protein
MKVFQTVAAAGAIALVGSLSAHAASLPTSGEVHLDETETFKVVTVVEAGGVKTAIFEGTGIARGPAGDGPFHLLAMHCLGHAAWIKGGEDWEGNANCAFTDKDGDSFMSSWHVCKDCKSPDHLVGGSGKFKGITGNMPGGEAGSVYDDPLRGWAFLGYHDLKWEIK